MVVCQYVLQYITNLPVQFLFVVLLLVIGVLHAFIEDG